MIDSSLQVKNYQDEFRDAKLIAIMAENIAKMGEKLDKSVKFMEVCGTHTMSIYQNGIRSLLPSNVNLISGPGCPVCVTPISYVDKAIALSEDRKNIITTFGDMLRVPGSRSSLLREKAKGADIRIVYSPLDAVSIAASNLDRNVIFLGVGFETTAPTIAASIMAASSKKLTNYFVLSANKTMPLPMELLTADPDLALSGYLCPAHVSTVIGGKGYLQIASKYKIPCVVTGFEPADVMQGIEMLLMQIINKEAKVEIQYKRAVTFEGNKKAQAIIAEVFRCCDAEWRGLGTLPDSGLAISEKYADFDAEKMFDIKTLSSVEPKGCRCGDILKGKIAPPECPLFGKICTPEAPVGACMVSSEGSCAAAFKYGEKL